MLHSAWMVFKCWNSCEIHVDSSNWNCQAASRCLPGISRIRLHPIHHPHYLVAGSSNFLAYAIVTYRDISWHMTYAVLIAAKAKELSAPQSDTWLAVLSWPLELLEGSIQYMSRNHSTEQQHHWEIQPRNLRRLEALYPSSHWHHAGFASLSDYAAAKPWDNLRVVHVPGQSSSKPQKRSELHTHVYIYI